MRRPLFFLFVLFSTLSSEAQAPDLARLVRLKLAAGDLLSGMAAVEDHRRATGIDTAYLDAVGWLARGAEMLGREDLAQEYVAELRREIPHETEERLVPLGAAIEVEGRLLATRAGRGAAIRFFQRELARAEAPALRSRLAKNINLLSLEGQPTPAIGSSLEPLRGKPLLLYFFAEWCGDCKAQAASLSRVWEKYRPRGLGMVAITRLYGGTKEKPYTPEEEQAQVKKVWKEVYGGLSDVPVVISTEAMVRYGASATPTFAIIDRGRNRADVQPDPPVGG